MLILNIDISLELNTVNSCLADTMLLWTPRQYGQHPGAPLTYLNDGGSKDFFGSDILAKRNFSGL